MSWSWALDWESGICKSKQILVSIAFQKRPAADDQQYNETSVYQHSVLLPVIILNHFIYSSLMLANRKQLYYWQAIDSEHGQYNAVIRIEFCFVRLTMIVAAYTDFPYKRMNNSKK